MITAIVLAAGKSERMGGRPKALLPLRGRTFLENILDAIAQSSLIHFTAVVVGHHRAEIERAVKFRPLVFNPDYEKGMITSFQAGIRALPGGVEGSFLFLVDHPLVDSTTIQALAAKAAPDRIILPTFQGRRGHPVFFGAEILQELLVLPATQGANVVVRKDQSRIIEVPVKAAGIVVDIDTLEDFERL